MACARCFLLASAALVWLAFPGAAWAAERMPFTEGWRFQLEPSRDCDSLADDDSAWRPVRLPHTWNDVDTFDGKVGYARGRGCYRHALTPDPAWKGKVVRVEFLGAYASARVWLDGASRGAFDGDYTGFHVDFDGSELVAHGPARLDVAVSNEASKDVLPGRPDPDYNLYGGLYREAYLEVLDPLHVEPDATVARPTPMNDRVWLVPVVVGLANSAKTPADARVSIEIQAPDGSTEAVAQTAVQVAASGTAKAVVDVGPIDSPALWSPASPALHSVKVTVLTGERVADMHHFAVGLRTFAWDAAHGFLLNGSKLELKGANRHQDFPGLGNALPAGFQELDARLIHDMGGNFVRTSHYPQHPAFLDACDRLGIVVFEEIATWKTVGGAGFVNAAKRMMRAMIRRDRNHPSIVLWGMMNEGRSKEMFEKLKAIAAEEDGTRGVGYAEHRFEKALKQGTADLADAIGLNYRPEKLAEFRAAYPRGAFFVSEHTNLSHTDRGDWSAELAQVRAIDADLGLFAGLPWLGGHVLWSLHDYGTERPGKKTRTIHTSGAVDAARIPRASYRYLAARWSEVPRVEILTPPVASAVGVIVPIATNCARLALRVDGRDQGERAAKPLVEWPLDQAPRSIEAIGRCGTGDVTARWEKPGPAARIVLSSTLDVLPRDGSNLALVTIRVEDAAGRLAADFRGDVVIAAAGPARARTIAGRGLVPVVAGQGGVAVEDTGAGRVRVIAAFGGLTSTNLVLTAH